MRNVKIFIIAGPQEKFTEQELKVLKEFINGGGKMMILLGEGGEPVFNTNINFLLEEYGININNDAVVRPHYYKYFHPKEAIINGGVSSDKMAKILLEKLKNAEEPSPIALIDEKYKIEFVYPYGATLNVIQPSFVLLTTGPVVYPFNRPIVGYFSNEKNGKILAIGSGHMFSDKYINDESNVNIWDFFLTILTEEDFKFDNLDLTDVEINEFTIIPDTMYMSEQPKACLVESIDCDIPADFKKMFDMHLHSINTNLLKDVIAAYEKLGVQYEPLKIIKPQFEIPLPPLQLAVFPPVYSDLSPPVLELFDLDEAFSSERAQVAQLTNKCLNAADDDPKLKKSTDEKELEYFIKECGQILNVFQDYQKVTAKEILNTIGVKIAQYKKLDRE